MKKAPLAEDIFAVLSDGITIKMFKMASTGFRVRGGLYKKLKITRKQYISRLRKLMATGLIHKRSAVYVLTALGQIVDKTILRMTEESADNYWKLKAIDSFEKDLPLEEKHNMIDAMLSDTLIRDTIAKYA